jgi:hypothetical protein
MKLLRWNNARPQGDHRERKQNREPRIADRGWKSRKVSPLPVEGEVFFLTFPFIDQAFTLKFQLLSIHFTSEPFEKVRKTSAMGILQQLTRFIVLHCGAALD